MNTKLQKENARIAKTMQAKAANGKTNGINTKSVKPATRKLQTSVTLTKMNSAPKATTPINKAHANKPTTTAPAPVSEPKPAEPVTMPVPIPQPEPAAPAAALSADKPAKTDEPKVAQQLVLRAGVLKAAIKNVDRARGKNSTLPVLSHILIETLDEDTVRFTATDLNFTLWRLAQAKVLQRGRACLPDLLGDLIAKVNDDLLVTLTTSTKTWKTRVEAGRLTFTIHGMDPSEFPQAAAFNGKSIVIGADLSHEAVKEIVHRVVPFVSPDDARPILQGILLTGILPAESGKNATLLFVSADGFRLAVLEREATLHFDVDNNPGTLALIVPARVFSEIPKITTEDAKPIQFMFHLQMDAKGTLEHGMVQVETHAGGLRMNLLDGSFPDFTQIVPNPIPPLPFLPLLAEPTVVALGRAALVSPTQTALLSVQPDQVLVSASGADTGNLAESIPALFDLEWKPADNFEIAFNAGFLSEAVRAAAYGDGTKPVQLRVSEPSKPAFISVPRYRHVLMPMHIGGDDEAKESPQPQAVPPVNAEPSSSKPQAEAKEPAAQTKGNAPHTPNPTNAKTNGKTKSSVTPVAPAKKKTN